MILGFCTVSGQTSGGNGSEISLKQVSAAAKIYFRDTAELSMTVSVTTTVTDQSGKIRKHSQGTVKFLFHGYNPGTGKGTFTGQYGLFHKRTYMESLSGSVALISAGMFLRPETIERAGQSFDLQQPTGPGQALIVRQTSSDCAAFKLMEGAIFPESLCGRAEYRVRLSKEGDVGFEHFRFENAGLPAIAKMDYFGTVKILAYQADENFQSVFLPGDSRPFVLPKQVTTIVTTEKGKISITNEYAVPPQKNARKN
jgi:hypothetical protein